MKGKLLALLPLMLMIGCSAKPEAIQLDEDQLGKACQAVSGVIGNTSVLPSQRMVLVIGLHDVAECTWSDETGVTLVPYTAG